MRQSGRRWGRHWIAKTGMDIGIKGGGDLLTGNVVCNGHDFELPCSLVYRRWDGGIARTFGGIWLEYGVRLRRHYRDRTLYSSITSPIRIFTHVRLTLACRSQEFRATVALHAI